MKDNERKRVWSHSSPKSSPPKKVSTSHCDHEEPGMVWLVLLCENKQLKTCYGCKNAIEDDNPECMSVAEELYRTWFDKVSRSTRVSFQKMWAYFHTECHKAKKPNSILHVCEHHHLTYPMRRKIAEAGYVVKWVYMIRPSVVLKLHLSNWLTYFLHFLYAPLQAHFTLIFYNFCRRCIVFSLSS